MFGENFLKTLVQNIQIYGVSLCMFKHTIDYLIANFIYNNDYFYVNALFENITSSDLQEVIEVADSNQIYELIAETDNSSLIPNLDKCLATTHTIKETKIDELYTPEDIVNRMTVFLKKKQKYLQAYEVIEDFCASLIQEPNQSHALVYKH